MRVLVVEDEPDLRSVISQALREEGYAVDTAEDGEVALYHTRSWEYDALVLDLMLPKVDGLEVLKSLRMNRKTPVLILTARDTVTDRVRGLDVGADDYLVKPFALAELLARLRAIIRRSAGLADSKIVIGAVVIDLRTRTVTRAGVDVVMTAREFAILEMLAVNRGSVVTKTQIYEHIFSADDDSLSNLVEVHVSNIRKKLGKEFIETRRGMGYVLEG